MKNAWLLRELKKNTEVNNSDLGTVTGSAACHQVDGRKPQGEWPAAQERYQLWALEEHLSLTGIHQ